MRLACVCMLLFVTASFAAKPRLIVLTDISSLDPDVREPDDGQSLVRLLLYTNDIDVEGLIASSNMGHGHVVRPELIRQAIDAYAKVHPNLLLHSPDYPAPDTLLATVKSGQPIADKKLPFDRSIGDGKDTEASDWIIRCADRDDPRPLRIIIWGGAADLAQALWKVKHSRPQSELDKFLAKLRVHAISDQDSTSPWIRETFPSLHYVHRTFGYRGMYRGGDESLCTREWVDANLNKDHGPLGALYPNYDGGDIWGRVKGVKEGDTPSFLGLIPNGLNDPDQPTWHSWGGRSVQKDPSRPLFLDAQESYPGSEKDRDIRMNHVWRWRPAYQNDFAARMDWCVKAFKEANHPPVVKPVVKLNTSTPTKLSAGQSTTFTVAATDPDGDALAYQWMMLDGPGDIPPADAMNPTLTFTAPADARPQTIHLLCTVRDGGSPPLVTYARAIVTISP
jgi:hypothetical protein